MADERTVTQARPRASRTGLRGWAIRLAPVAAGVAIGVVVGMRALSLWGSGHARVPAEGLIFMGSILVVGGLAQLHPGLWRRGHEANMDVLSRLPVGRPGTPVGRVLRSTRDGLIAREERESRTPAIRHRIATGVIVAGITVICSALLR